MVTTGETTVTHLGTTYSTTALGRQAETPLKICPDCQGSGELYTRKCRNCNGRGLIVNRTMSKPDTER
jgi:DnaJ-class molecular chaperone